MTMSKTSNLTTGKIEQIIKQLKTHWCAIALDSASIKSVIVKCEEQYNKYIYRIVIIIFSVDGAPSLKAID